MAALSFIVLLFTIFHPVFSFPEEDCPAVSCGSLGKLIFPFTNTTSPPFCGPFIVDDCGTETPKVRFWRDSEKWYEIQSVSQTDFITNISVIDEELRGNLDSSNCESFDWSLPESPLAHVEIISKLATLYKCKNFVPALNSDFDHKNCSDYSIIYPKNVTASLLPSPPPHPPPLPLDCSTQLLPVNTENTDDHNIFTMFTANLSLQVTDLEDLKCKLCLLDGGECIRKDDAEFQQCLRKKHNGESRHIPLHTKTLGIKLGVGIGIITVLIILMLGIFFLWDTSIFCWKKNKQDHRSIEAFLGEHGSMAPKRYKYIEIKKITGSFKDKLGQGGYGSVFKGKLTDGNLVAVKVLKESKSNGEEFINEVASISRTSHVNIVTLLGFCFEGSKRALVYEFMSNGSLDKYIENPPNAAARQLGWETLQQIAVGIARGLEYLHRGCKTRILHFDIKPHNILLDVDLCPKISDFGLAKICLRKESFVSMLGARGTAGYIAPEVFCRNFGGVSHKSDVYSYGMLLFEMVGGRRNPSVLADNSSDIYFPHWIFKRLELGQELGLHGIGNEEDNQIARKMVLVSLWCIQSDPSKRPPMSRVIEMLQGNAESLSIPPKPYLSSPSRSPPRSGASSSTIVSLNCSLKA